jgi:hypothetical protein
MRDQANPLAFFAATIGLFFLVWLYLVARAWAMSRRREKARALGDQETEPGRFYLNSVALLRARAGDPTGLAFLEARAGQGPPFPSDGLLRAGGPWSTAAARNDALLKAREARRWLEVRNAPVPPRRAG